MNHQLLRTLSALIIASGCGTAPRATTQVTAPVPTTSTTGASQHPSQPTFHCIHHDPPPDLARQKLHKCYPNATSCSEALEREKGRAHCHAWPFAYCSVEEETASDRMCFGSLEHCSGAGGKCQRRPLLPPSTEALWCVDGEGKQPDETRRTCSVTPDDCENHRTNFIELGLAATACTGHPKAYCLYYDSGFSFPSTCYPTVGECSHDIEALPALRRARDAGVEVDCRPVEKPAEQFNW